MPGRRVHVGHELAHGAGHDVPRQVHRHQEHDRLHVHRIGQRAAHHLDEGVALALSRGLLFRPVLRLLQLALQIPRDERHHEQDEEQQTHGEQAVEGPVGARRQKRAIRPEGGEDEREQKRDEEDDRRAAGPGELADADVGGAARGGGHLGDVAPRRRYAGAHGQAGNDDAGAEHGQVHRAHNEEDARGVHEQVIGVDELAPEAVGQKAADERAHRRAEGIRAHGAQDGHPHVVEVESNRPGRQRHTRGHDAAGVEEVGE